MSDKEDSTNTNEQVEAPNEVAPPKSKAPRKRVAQKPVKELPSHPATRSIPRFHVIDY